MPGYTAASPRTPSRRASTARPTAQAVVRPRSTSPPATSSRSCWRVAVACRAASTPLALYRALRMVNPSPYMVLLESPEVALVGASPEMLVRKEGRRLETRPIAGTRPRGVDAEADQRLAAELLADPKERAEHVMLVDLGRNDLGRVAAPGSVRGRQLHGGRALQPRHAPGVERRGRAGRRPRRRSMLCSPASRPARSPARRRSAPWRSSTSSSRRRAAPMPAPSATSPSPAISTPASPSAPWWSRGTETSVTAGAGIVADSDPAREEQETENKAARCSPRSPSPGAGRSLVKSAEASFYAV